MFGHRVAVRWSFRPYGSGQQAGLQSGDRRADDIRPHPKEKNCPQRAATGRPYAKKEKPEGEGDHSVDHILSLRAQRRSEASQEVLCQAFFQESGGGLEFF